MLSGIGTRLEAADDIEQPLFEAFASRALVSKPSGFPEDNRQWLLVQDKIHNLAGSTLVCRPSYVLEGSRLRSRRVPHGVRRWEALSMQQVQPRRATSQGGRHVSLQTQRSLNQPHK